MLILILQPLMLMLYSRGRRRLLCCAVCCVEPAAMLQAHTCSSSSSMAVQSCLPVAASRNPHLLPSKHDAASLC